MSVDPKTIAFAHRLADASGAIIRPFFRQRIEVVDKGASVFDPVTEADKGAEEAIRAIIHAERPEDGILGEEYGEHPGTNGRRWVLDPVDGTRAFITGRHEWGSLIALEEGERPVLGILDQPVLGERFIGVNGRSEFHFADTVMKLEARECTDLSQAVLCATHPTAYFNEAERAALTRIERITRLSRYGGDCYVFGLLAMGFVDLIVESTFKRWDVAALIPIVEGAGGVITDWRGNSCHEGGQAVASGDPRLHEQALALLKDAAN
ncbi:MAG TPA: histidinol-phosphatase [Rhizomicrobium sp.]|jgi:histidinol phosphatase-like enzyme (inositol monophosphatase family)|nr:histidinol-phosphatase [Rhizomicrobium sp.]